MGIYGTMHAKLMLLRFDSFLRVVITSANVTEFDWCDIGQTIWIFDAKQKSAITPQSDFGTRLVDFVGHLLSEASPENKQLWLSDVLPLFNFNTSFATLIVSVPGLWGGDQLNDFGQMRLKSVLVSHGLSENKSVHVKVSSLGLCPDNWMKEFEASLGLKTPVRIHWPSFTDAMALSGRGILKGSLKNVSLLSRRLTRLQLHNDRKSFACHAKFIVGESAGGSWVYVGSHNLSRVAWGTVNATNNTLSIASFELGVLLESDQYPLSFTAHDGIWPNDQVPWSSEIYNQLLFLRKNTTPLVDPGDYEANLARWSHSGNVEPFGDFLVSNSHQICAVVILDDSDWSAVALDVIRKSLLPEGTPQFVFSLTGVNTCSHLGIVAEFINPSILPCLALVAAETAPRMLASFCGADSILGTEPDDVMLLIASYLRTTRTSLIPQATRLVCLSVDTINLLQKHKDFISSLDDRVILAILADRGQVGLRHWMLSGKWGDPSKLPDVPSAEESLKKLRSAASILFKGTIKLYTSFRYVGQSGKMSPRPSGTAADIRWNDNMRKPGPGMIQAAMADVVASPNETVFVSSGSAIDAATAEAAGVAYISLK